MTVSGSWVVCKGRQYLQDCLFHPSGYSLPQWTDDWESAIRFVHEESAEWIANQMRYMVPLTVEKLEVIEYLDEVKEEHDDAERDDAEGLFNEASDCQATSGASAE